MTEKRRLRIRFSKQDDLRLISHRDMVRSFERLFRRARAPLAMTQGFHPRPQLTFPDALSLGVVGLDEVTDVAVEGSVDTDELCRQLQAQAPEGLVIHSVRTLGPNERKVKVAKFEYAIRIPDDKIDAALLGAISELREQPSLVIRRRGKKVTVDLQEALLQLHLEDGYLRMGIRVLGQSQLQPRDLLAALGLADIVERGAVLTRTKVELAR